MAFIQNFQGTIGNVYNINGHLILSAQSNAEDLMREIGAMRGQLQELQGPDPATHQAVAYELDAAGAESQAKTPSGKTIQQHLESAASGSSPRFAGNFGGGDTL